VSQASSLVGTAVGWPAHLELRFERSGATTRLASNRHSGPLRLIRALPQVDGSCHAVLVHPPGGLVGGDSLEIDIGLGPAAHVLCTTPGNQKWYRSAQAMARAQTTVRVDSRGTLEWLPHPAMVYDGARTGQEVSFSLAEDARMIGWECLVLGRTAMGERFTRGSLRQRLSLSIEGRTTWSELTQAEAGDRLFASPLGWRGHCVSASVWAVGPLDESLLATWRDILAGFEGRIAASAGPRFAGAASRLAPKLLLARLLADDAEPVTDAARALWAASRPIVLEAAARAPRIWAT
jgi:urease accessory protein